MSNQDMKKIQAGDEKFISDLNAAIMHRHSKLPFILISLIGAFVVFIIIWANFSQIEIMTRGGGEAVPSTEVQVIQNLEGGIIAKLNAKEGAHVKAGELLVKLDNSKYLSAFKEMEAEKASNVASLKRLYAELKNEPILNFPPELEANKTSCDTQRALFESRVKHYNAMVDGLASKGEHLKLEVQEQRLTLIRLEAELNKRTPVFPEGLTGREKVILDMEKSLFESRDKIYVARKVALKSNKALVKREAQSPWGHSAC